MNSRDTQRRAFKREAVELRSKVIQLNSDLRIHALGPALYALQTPSKRFIYASTDFGRVMAYFRQRYCRGVRARSARLLADLDRRGFAIHATYAWMQLGPHSKVERAPQTKRKNNGSKQDQA